MHCIECGYSLAGLDRQRCPECGRPFVRTDPSTWNPNPGKAPKLETYALIGGATALAIAAALPIWWICYQGFRDDVLDTISLYGGVARAARNDPQRGDHAYLLPGNIIIAVLVFAGGLFAGRELGKWRLRRFRTPPEFPAPPDPSNEDR